MSWETEMAEAAYASALGRAHGLIDEVWQVDPELFFTEFATRMDEKGRAEAQDEIKNLFFAIADSCREIAFNIYALEK